MGNSDEERLRADLRDYYGTAMFNGNPMAMMELEEVERASGDDLRYWAREAGIDSARYGHSPQSDYHPGTGSMPSSGFGSPSVGVSVATRSEAIGPAATRFFETSGTNSSEGFFSHYGRMLRDKALHDEEPSIGDND